MSSSPSLFPGGAAYGGGAGTLLGPAWSAIVEYRLVPLGSQSVTLSVPLVHLVRVRASVLEAKWIGAVVLQWTRLF